MITYHQWIPLLIWSARVVAEMQGLHKLHHDLSLEYQQLAQDPSARHVKNAYCVQENAVDQACKELLRGDLAAPESLESVRTLVSLSGGLNRLLNPYLSLMERLGRKNVLVKHVETEINRSYDVNIIKAWILNRESKQPMMLSEGDCSMISRRDWVVSFNGSSEWYAMFRLLFDLQIQFGGSDWIRYKILNIGKAMHGREALLERLSETGTFICILPPCLYASSQDSLSHLYRVPTAHIVQRQRCDCWNWFSALWGITISHIISEHRLRLQMLLQFVIHHREEFFLDFDTFVDYYLLTDPKYILDYHVLQSLGLSEAGWKLLLQFYIPSISDIVSHIPLLSKLHHFIATNAGKQHSTDTIGNVNLQIGILPPSCVPWVHEDPNLVEAGPNAKSHKNEVSPNAKSHKNEVSPKNEEHYCLRSVPFTLMYSDSSILANVQSMLSCFCKAVKPPINYQNRVDYMKGLVSLKVMLHSTCICWMDEFIKRYLILLLSIEPTSKKRKRDSESMSDIDGEVDMLHNIICFAFQEINWVTSLSSERLFEASAAEVTAADLVQILKFWCEFGLRKMVSYMLMILEDNSSLNPINTEASLFLVLRLIISLVSEWTLDQNTHIGIDFLESLILRRKRQYADNDDTVRLMNRDTVLKAEIQEIRSTCKSLFDADISPCNRPQPEGICGDGGTPNSNRNVFDEISVKTIRAFGSALLRDIDRWLPLREYDQN